MPTSHGSAFCSFQAEAQLICLGWEYDLWNLTGASEVHSFLYPSAEEIRTTLFTTKEVSFQLPIYPFQLFKSLSWWQQPPYSTVFIIAVSLPNPANAFNSTHSCSPSVKVSTTALLLWAGAYLCCSCRQRWSSLPGGGQVIHFEILILALFSFSLWSVASWVPWESQL